MADDFGKWAGTFGAPSHLYDEGTSDWSQFVWDPLGMFSPPSGIDFEYTPSDYQFDPEFAAALQAQAMGKGGPSVAEQQLRSGLEHSTKQAQAVAATQRGLDPAMAARMGTATASAMSRDVNQQAAALRAQEQMTAQQRYMQLEQIRAQQAAQQAAQRNQLDFQKAMQEQANAQQAKGGMLGALGGALGSIVSDANAKRDITPLAWGDVREFLGALRPLIYEYTEPERPGRRDGPQVGVIAQDIRNTRIGRTIVEPTPDGLVLNAHGAISALLAVVGAMGRRIEQLEATQDAPRAY